MAGAMGLDFEYVHGDVAIDDQAFPNVGVRYKGNGTYMQGQIAGKLSFKIQLDRFNRDQRLGRMTTLNLHSNISDATFMNETLAYRLYRDAGVAAPRTSYARVYVTVTGQQQNKYLGLYSVVENPDEAFFEAHGLPPNGAIFKPVTRNLFSDAGPDWAAYSQVYDPKTKLTDAQKQRVIDLARLVTSADDDTFVRDIGSYVDLDAAARYLAVSVFLVDLDGLLNTGQNYYMHLNATTNRFSFTPWDQDRSWGQFFLGGTQQQREELDILRPWLGENRFLTRLFGVEAFRKLYLERMQEYSASIFDPARIARQVDEVARVVRPAVGEESATGLVRFDQAVSGESLPPILFNGRPFGAPNPIVPIKGFVLARARAVQAQLVRLAGGAE
jgi:spore coat protein CotH